MEVLGQTPSDDAVIHPLRLTLARLGRAFEMRKLYEQLATADPQNKDHTRNLFFALAKESKFKEQQMVAMKLYHLQEKDKYFHWSIASNFLLAGGSPFVQDGEVKRLGEASQPSSDGRLLNLSEMLLKKRFEIKPPTSLGVFLLYLSILTSQGKYQEAEAALRKDSAFASLFKEDHVRLKYYGRVCGHLGRWRDMLQTYRGLLESHQPDDWGYVKNYFNALFCLRSSDQGAKLLEEAVAFFQRLQSEHPKLRGPFLSEVELSHRLLQAQDVESNETHLKTLLTAYFKRFGSRPVCYYDIERYILALEGSHQQADQDAFIELLRSTVEPLSVDTNAAVKEQWYTAQATIEKFRRRLGLHSQLSLDDLVALAQQLWNLYLASAESSTKKEETEIGPGEDLALLAGHLMLDTYRKSGALGYVVAGAAILQCCLKRSKFNFQIKVLLIRFYRILDAAAAAYELYTSLEVKYIQHDTISHLVLDILITHGMYAETLTLCQQTRHFHELKTKEIYDWLPQPFQSENYHKITEMLDFADQLRRSHQLAVVRTEELLLMLGLPEPQKHDLLPPKASMFIAGLPPHPDNLVVDEETATRLAHNQDPVVVEWDAPDTLHPPSDGLASSADMGLGRSSVEEQKRWLRARSLVARVLHRLVNLASTSVPPPVDAAQQPQTTSKGPPGKAGGVKAKNAKAKAFNELANPAQATATSTLDKSAFLTSAREALDQLGKLLSGLLLLEGDAALTVGTESNSATGLGTKETRIDIQAWRMVWLIFNAFFAIAQLVQSVHENKVEERTLQSTINDLRALPGYFEELVQRAVGILAADTAGCFNGAALREVNFVVAYVSTWAALLFKVWSAAFPAKQRRKNHPANMVQEAKALLVNGAASMAHCLESMDSVLGRHLDNATALKPSLTVPVAPDFQPKEEVASCTHEILQKVLQSWQYSMRNLKVHTQHRIATFRHASQSQ